jgi:beta-lactam-binding protein with PASTA domain
MASEPERPASDEDTAALEGNGRPASDEAWPVSDLYYVRPGDEAATASEPIADDVSASTVVTSHDSASPGRRFPPNPAVGAALVLLGVAAALVLGAVLLGRDGDPAATAQAPTGPATTTPPAETTTAPVAANVEVANVEGRSLAEARAALQDQGLTVRVTRSPSERPQGEVLNQEPPAGSDIAEGTVVALVVSRGSAAAGQASTDVTVPRVVGLSRSDAIAALRDAGLQAQARLVTSPERRGTVIDQSPAEGADVARGSTVQLEVAKPPAVTVQRVEVPDVVGSTASTARSELRAAGLTVATVAVVSQDPAGTVISQSPRAGAEVREGARVRVTVSSGPAEVAVPDVTGLDEAPARQELEAAGFQVRVTDESVTDPAEDGLVLRQTPPGGSSAEDGAVVTLVVGRLG